MNKPLIYPLGTGRTAGYAVRALPFPTIDHPAPEVTHVLLDVPSFHGGTGEIERVLPMLPQDIGIIGGRLEHPIVEKYRRIDLLQDATYVAKNAGITARCAVRLAVKELDSTLADCPVLILGWGRIGKCLASLLKALGAEVTVAARKEADRGMLTALGYKNAAFAKLEGELSKYRILYNTVPEMILPDTGSCPANCLKIELASLPGMGGDNIIDGRGLPGKLAPESSGKLIAETIARLYEEGAL